MYKALSENALKFFKSDFFDFFLVLIFGAFGGLLYWIWRTLHDTSATWIDLIKYVILGSGSSVILVFLIFNTNRENRTRFYATSVLGGLLFLPVISGVIVGTSQAEKYLIKDLVERPSKAEQTSKGNVAERPTRLEQLEELIHRARYGENRPQMIENLEVIEIPQRWATIDHSEDGRIDRLIEVFERTEVKIEVESKDQHQDLTAWLFKVEGRTLRLFDSNDDSAPGNTDPVVQTILEPSRYVLRILPYENEAIEPIRIRIRIVLR